LILIATGSTHKLGELRELLELPRSELVGLDSVGLSADAPEEGETLAENALAKAHWYAERSGLPTLADDSGLEVDALDGGPGIRTHRFAGPDATDLENNDHLLDRLRDVPPPGRSARYRCVLAFVEPNEPGEAVIREGVFEGRIAMRPRGQGGFGYDPIFEPATEPIGGRTVGEMSRAEKNGVSHRALAARAIAAALAERGY
jgi:XTP/dITP diphosphohydrolase